MGANELVFFGSQPQHLIQNTYGLLLQTNYKFDEPNLLLNTNYKEQEDSPPYYSGLYVGANIAYSTYTNSFSIDSTFNEKYFSQLNLNVQNNGFVGGGTFGNNWKIRQTVLGLEADLDYESISGSNADTSSATNFITSVNKKINWVGTLRGRIGRITPNNMMIYLTAGPAFGNTQITFAQRVVAGPKELPYSMMNSCSSGLVCASATSRKTKLGWTAGGGLEYPVSKRATFKAEYLYVTLGNVTMDIPGDGLLQPLNYKVNTIFNTNIFRLGVNYRI